MELAIGLPPDELVGAGREHFDEQQEIEWKRQELLYVYGAGLIIIPRRALDRDVIRSACNAANASARWFSLAYNLKRVIAILGVEPLVAAIRE